MFSRNRAASIAVAASTRHGQKASRKTTQLSCFKALASSPSPALIKITTIASFLEKKTELFFFHQARLTCINQHFLTYAHTSYL